MSVHYREFLPAPPLRDTVLCYWTLRSAQRVRAPCLNRILPDGCMDLLFELGDAVVAADEGPRPPRSWVVGAMERADVVWLSGDVDLLGVRLRPGGAPRYLEPPAGELRGRILPLEDLWGHAARSAHEQLAHATSTEPRVAALDALLLRRADSADTRAAPALHASRMIGDSAGTVPVRAIAQRLGISTRSLERRFEDAVGLSPRAARRVARFQNAVNLALAGTSASLASIALRAGFYDQAHFTREFTALCGLPPAAWRAERRTVATVQDVPAAFQ